MNINEISSLIGSIGLPSVIIVYMLWRLDKFLTKLTETLEKNYMELWNLSTCVKELVEYTKGARRK